LDAQLTVGPFFEVQVLRAVSDGLAACLLDRSDGNKTMLRAFSRELLAAAVLRNVMFYFTPYTVNKARRSIYTLLMRSNASLFPQILRHTFI